MKRTIDPTDEHSQHLRDLRASADAASQAAQEREKMAKMASGDYPEWLPADRVCACCSKVMVDADEAWWCDGCQRWVCWRCKTAILPPLDAPAPRIRIECDTCRQHAAMTAQK